MKLRIMLYGLTLMLGCFVLASCVNDGEELCLPDSSGKTQVLFSLVLQDNAKTRAGENWGNYDPRDTGVGYDNQIDLDNVQFLLFKEEVKEVDEQEQKTYLYAGKLANLTYTIPGDPRYDYVYDYIGDAPGLESGDYKFVVLANSPVPTLTKDQSTIEDLYNLDFSYLGNNTLPNIPMWGTKGVTDKTKLTVKAGTRHDIGTINLLRAVSKVTVQLDDAVVGFSLKNIKVNYYNTKGYVLPSGYADVAETTDLELVGDGASLHPNTNNSSTDKTFTAAEAAKELTFYLPEYANATASNHVAMDIVLTDSNGNEYPFPAGIEFKDYNGDGNVFDIIRNHHYIFTITGVEVGHKLTLTVKTLDWDDKNVTVSYTEQISWNEGSEPKWVTPGTKGKETIDGIEYNVLYVNGGDDLMCSFTLSTPEGWIWYAELEPLTTEASNYIYFDGDTTMPSGSVGQPATLYVKIATGSTSMQRSRLRMYVSTPSGDKTLEVKNLHYIISRDFDN